jgi:hypothetical protein
MDHTAVVRQKMTEKYLLDELDSQVRDEFEEHYFDCPECASDVRTETEFVVHSKVILAESAEPVAIRAARPEPARGGWLAWLRPAFAAPALSLLLLVAGYQNLVTLPRLRSDAKPQVFPTASAAVGIWGAGGTPVTMPAGKGLVVFLRIPPDGAFSRYTAELYAPGGKLEGSFDIAEAAGQDEWTVSAPAVERQAGTYTISVQGFTAAGEKKDLPGTSFEVQIQR